jgi:hypothetical protein
MGCRDFLKDIPIRELPEGLRERAAVLAAMAQK